MDLRHVLVFFDWVIFAYFLLINSFYALLLISASWSMRRHLLTMAHESSWRVLGSEVAPVVSVLAPAFNEGSTIAESVRALITLHYPNLEVVLVNDGSSDNTLDVLKREFELVAIHPIYRHDVDSQPVNGLYKSRVNPELVVVDKRNGGKADSLNAGLNVATGDLICAIDADTLIEPDALLRMVRPFLLRDDVVAAGGTIRVANACEVSDGRVIRPRVPKRPLAGIQVVEYLRAFLFGRLGWNSLGGNLIISGAFGLFRREAMIAAGGYVHDTVGEDMELVAELRRRGIMQKGPHRVDFVPDPVAWTEVPESVAVLGRQRDRWHRGLTDVLWRYRGLFLNYRFGALGLVVYPYFLLVELLSPIVEALGLLSVVLSIALGAINMTFAVLFFLVAYGYGLLLSLFALLLEQLSFRRYPRLMDRALLLLWALAESFGYRQLTVWWRLRGVARFIGKRTDWGEMTRRGFSSPEDLSQIGPRPARSNQLRNP
jgi:cellulose synthase/poly-beta-1,6-N-acetylglucosamine synthase-like glycosyltransferase